MEVRPGTSAATMLTTSDEGPSGPGSVESALFEALLQAAPLAATIRAPTTSASLGTRTTPAFERVMDASVCVGSRRSLPHQVRSGRSTELPSYGPRGRNTR